MRLDEIKGDTETDVIDRLMKIKKVVNYCANTLNPSIQIKELTKLNLNEFNNDTQNLLFWVSRSKKIETLYNNIKDLSKIINW